MKNKIIEILDALEKNPIFRVSLSSRELFHSNFWAWLIDKYYKEFTGVFYPKYDGTTKPEVLREEHNFDLSLKFDNKFVIIENKFKSLPDEKQLKDYRDKASKKINKEIEIILISYMEPLFEMDNKLSYKDLHKKLKDVDISKITLPDREIIKSYIDCIGLLVQLKDCSFENIETFDEFEKMYKADDLKAKELKSKLDKINFDLTLQRIFLGQLISNKLKLENTSYQIKTGNNHVAYIDIFGKNPNAWVAPCCNGEYRYIFKVEKSTDRKTKEQLIDYCDSKYREFLSDKGCKESKRCYKGYNSFMGKDCAWIYKKIDKNMTFQELASKIKNDLSELEKFE